MDKFDVLVIGGGPGGYVAAIKAASLGKKTAIIEKESLGGVCLNWGCIPTKSLLRNAEIIRDLSQGGTFGFEITGFKADYAKAHKRSREVSAKLVAGIEYLMRKNNITVFKDTAKFLSAREVELTNAKQKITASNIIIAAGSQPFRLPILDYTKEWVLDSKKALQLTKVPKSILIIGAGAIGMEFATVFGSYGSKVTIVEMLPRVLPNEDAAISAIAEKEFKKKGFAIYTAAKVVKVCSGGKFAHATIEKEGKTIEIEAEYVLGATGIKPNTDSLDLQKFGYKLDGRGYISVDLNMQTNVPGVYAIGDITGKCALAHTASAQGILAANHICGKHSKPINYDNIPKCTYASPECASAGLTEDGAKQAGYDVGTAVFPFSANGKAISYGEDVGMVKLVYDKKYGQLLGAHLCGVHVTEMIWGIVGYLGMEMTVEEMAEVIHPHPTVSETIMEAAHIACGHAIHI